ncbi:hypothetical protein BJV78DRAFT_1280066 [Lactifluus subvellereus]|nr:hypothetical protein BJV78DRAFT_1280066 [Lactifluus subvellereus]
MINSYQKLNPGAKLNDFETQKAFILMLAKAIDGRYGDPNACLRTVRQYWKNTTAGLDREGERVDPEIINSTTYFIEGDLQKESGLPRQKRARKFGTMSVFLILGARLWGSDWHKYTSPKDRLDLWDSIMLKVFTSARVGEYIESTAREESGRGLRYKDLVVGVFRNEQGDPEFFMEVKKDGKGIRAGFDSLTNHDFRAEALRAAEEKCTPSQRRRQAGHGSDAIYDDYYAPTNPGTDGQALYAGDNPRTLLPKLLRILKMNHNPELAQTLPARELHELVTSDEYSSILVELENLPDSDDATIKKERSEILGRLRGLKLAAPKKYREEQKENPLPTAKTAKTEKDEGHYRTPFSRIRHLMPIRQRLSESLFTVATIRSEAGRAVLEDLIELYRSEFEKCPPGPTEQQAVTNGSDTNWNPRPYSVLRDAGVWVGRPQCPSQAWLIDEGNESSGSTPTFENPPVYEPKFDLGITTPRRLTLSYYNGDELHFTARPR